MPWLRLANGTEANVKMARTREKRCSCGKVADFLCDFITSTDAKKTCSAAICGKCKTTIGGCDYCWRHSKGQITVPAQGRLPL